MLDDAFAIRDGLHLPLRADIGLYPAQAQGGVFSLSEDSRHQSNCFRHFEKEPRRLPCNHRKPKKKRVTGEKESNAVQSGKKPILRTMAKWLAPLASGPEADATSTRSSECPIIIRASSRQECSNFTVENARVPDR
ncbi:unnamed protein product [Effrenium voratum]|nr:unnamed protein product [Effrenium voratum]